MTRAAGSKFVAALSHCFMNTGLLPYIMPEISRFLGIVIAMFYRDHEPAHFRAKYGEYEITVEIGTGVVDGQFPRRALGHV